MNNTINHDCGCFYIQQTCNACNKEYEIEFTCFNCFKQSVLDKLCDPCMSDCVEQLNEDIDCDCSTEDAQVISNVDFNYI